MKKAAVALLTISLTYIILQMITGKYTAFYLPVVWIALLILPLFYLVIYKTSKEKMVFSLAYALIVLLLLLAQPFFLSLQNIGSERHLKITAPLLLVLQIGLWVQYYFWDRHQPEALTQGGNFAEVEAEKIRDLINDGRLEEALDRMTAGDELSAEQQAVVSNFAYRLGEIRRKEMMGLLTDEDATVERNKIVTGILSFL